MYYQNLLGDIFRIMTRITNALEYFAKGHKDLAVHALLEAEQTALNLASDLHELAQDIEKGTPD